MKIGPLYSLKAVVSHIREILVYNICLISISNSVSDGATNKSALNIERS